MAQQNQIWRAYSPNRAVDEKLNPRTKPLNIGRDNMLRRLFPNIPAN